MTVFLRGQQCEGFFYRACNEENLAVALLEEALGNTVVEKLKQLVIEAVDVEQDDRFLMQFECLPGKHLKHLFKGAIASGEDEEGVGLLAHERLACVHGAGDVKLGDAVVRDFEVNEDFRDNAYDTATGCQRGFCYSLHETNVRAAIDEADVALCQGAAQLQSSVTMGGVRAVGGGAEYSDVGDHRMRISGLARKNDDETARPLRRRSSKKKRHLRSRMESCRIYLM